MSALDRNAGAIQFLAVDSDRDAVYKFLVTPLAVAFICRQLFSSTSAITSADRCKNAIKESSLGFSGEN